MLTLKNGLRTALTINKANGNISLTRSNDGSLNLYLNVLSTYILKRKLFKFFRGYFYGAGVRSTVNKGPSISASRKVIDYSVRSVGFTCG